MRQTVAVGVIKAVDKKAASTGKVTKSAIKATKAKWIPAPDIQQQQGVSPASHPAVSQNLSSLLKDWLMLIKTHRKSFRRKGKQMFEELML